VLDGRGKFLLIRVALAEKAHEKAAVAEW